MKFSEQWLREWVQPNASSPDLAQQFTMAGLEVDAMEPVVPFFNGVVVAHVQNVQAHPNADRLRVCLVDVGESEPLSIVCGAPNVTPGAKVPCARIGARLPGDLNIKKGKLRGVESFGMLCSARELGLAEDSDGLLLLPDDAPTGADIRAYLSLNDVSFELGLTPNRGDCLSVAGVAREVGVINRCQVQGPVMTPVPAVISDEFPVTVEQPAACPRYLGRVIRAIDVNAATPMWMRERLRRSGVRSISAVVDVTNYVLLELGQPMHAFDLNKLQGGVVVRLAEQAERLQLLDGREVELDSDTLVISDHGGPLAMAGVMGGETSAVGDTTKDVLLEAAFFSPAAIVGRARRHGLHTDSSHRFERGVDPELTRAAMERATRLLLDIVGGQAGPVMERVSEEALPQRAPVRLRAARIERLLGMAVPAAEVHDIMTRLGVQVREQGADWLVTAPSYRFDLAIEADFIEELARVHGYSELPTHQPLARLALPAQAESRIEPSRIRHALVDRGYQEAITYSFVDPALLQRLDPEGTPVALLNPISAELAVMRTRVWPSLVQALMYNLNRQQNRVRLFEIGSRYLPDGEGVREEAVVAGLVSGSVWPEQWGERQRGVDFFDVKADVEALLDLTGLGQALRFEPQALPALHPGLAASLRDEQGDELGQIGALHPEVLRALDISGAVYLFELRLSMFERARLPRFRELSRFPAIRRDLALVVDEAVSADLITASVRAAAGECLSDLQLFDVYKGKGIDSGKKSLALGLTLQDSSRTLTDEEVDGIVQQVLSSLREQFEASLRD